MPTKSGSGSAKTDAPGVIATPAKKPATKPAAGKGKAKATETKAVAKPKPAPKPPAAPPAKAKRGTTRPKRIAEVAPAARTERLCKEFTSRQSGRVSQADFEALRGTITDAGYEVVTAECPDGKCRIEFVAGADGEFAIVVAGADDYTAYRRGARPDKSFTKSC